MFTGQMENELHKHEVPLRCSSVLHVKEGCAQPVICDGVRLIVSCSDAECVYVCNLCYYRLEIQI